MNTIPVIKTILYTNELSNAEKLIYIYLLKCLLLNNRTKNTFKTNNTKIAEKLHISRPTVLNAIKSLQTKGYIDLENNLIYLLQTDGTKDWITDETLFHSNNDIKTWGGFVEISKETLYSNELNANEKITLFKIQAACFRKNGKQFINKIHLNGIAAITNTPYITLFKNIKALKEKGFLDYDVKRIGNKVNDTEIINLSTKNIDLQEETPKNVIQLPDGNLEVITFKEDYDSDSISSMIEAMDIKYISSTV